MLQQGHKAHLDRCIDSGRPRRDAASHADPGEDEEEEEEDEEELQQIAEDEVGTLCQALKILAFAQRQEQGKVHADYTNTI